MFKGPRDQTMNKINSLGLFSMDGSSNPLLTLTIEVTKTSSHIFHLAKCPEGQRPPPQLRITELEIWGPTKSNLYPKYLNIST